MLLNSNVFLRVFLFQLFYSLLFFLSFLDHRLLFLLPFFNLYVVLFRCIFYQKYYVKLNIIVQTSSKTWQQCKWRLNSIIPFHRCRILGWQANIYLNDHIISCLYLDSF